MSKRALRHLIAPFASALADPRTTEIVVNRCGEFGVEAASKWTWHKNRSLTFDRLDSIGVLAAYNTAKEFSPAYPLCRTILPDGERLMVCRPPATLEGVISLTIRRPSETVMTVDDADFDDMFSTTNVGISRKTQTGNALIELYQQGAWRAFFKLAVLERKTIGVCGSMGSGKTTLLKRFLRCIGDLPREDRIITMEDTSEIKDVGPRNTVALFYDVAGLGAEDVLRAALRMRADRLLLQEVTGPEAFTFLRGLASGHSGYTTWHAEEGHEWDSLALMVRQHPAGRAIPEADMRRYLEQFLDIIVWVAKEDNEFRAPRVWLKGA